MNQPVHFVSPANQARPHATHVTVTDIDMPFMSMVSFMIKWALATIPAFIILAVVGGFFWGILALTILSR
jgi:hypothetical protein